MAPPFVRVSPLGWTLTRWQIAALTDPVLS
jgi:hypothetical protein